MPKGETPCQSCGTGIGPKSKTCKHCGATQQKKSSGPIELIRIDLRATEDFVIACGGAVEEAKRQLRSLRRIDIDKFKRCIGFTDKHGSIDDAIAAVERYDDTIEHYGQIFERS